MVENELFKIRHVVAGAWEGFKSNNLRGARVPGNRRGRRGWEKHAS